MLFRLARIVGVLKKLVEPNFSNTESQITIQPNPNGGEFIIRSKRNGAYKIYSQFGNEIVSFNKYEIDNYTVNLKGFANGIYFLKGNNGNQIVNEKIIIHNSKL